MCLVIVWPVDAAWVTRALYRLNRNRIVINPTTKTFDSP